MHTTNKKFKSIHAYSSASAEVTVGDNEPGIYLRTNGIDGVSLSAEDAKKIRDLLIERHGLPEPVTFQSQFAELAVGEQFVIRPGYSPHERSNAVKIDDERFFNYKKNWVKVAAGITSFSRIEKVG